MASIDSSLISNCSTGLPSGSVSFTYKFTPLFRLLRNEGNLVYEYNPLRNLRKSEALLKANSFDILLDENGDEVGEYMGLKLTRTTAKNLINYGYMPELPSRTVAEERAGALVDFTTDLLKFDLNHPVQIECQPSYDGSVNLILNDDKNIPRLINTRFTPLENDTYKIINRTGNNDTNIYDEETFDIDTSLYKRVSTIPMLTFKGVVNGGSLKVGNYVFYFRYEDADGNLTDFVSESGVVTCHVGGVNDISSIRGGIRDENSYKIISFSLDNVDPGYDYVKVYYTRSTSDYDGQEITSAHIIDTKYYIRGTSCSIVVTGFEPVSDISLNDINVQYNISNAVKSAAQNQGMLFLGNTSRPEIPYEELSDLSLRIYPIAVASDNIGNVSPEYEDTTNGFEYYNVSNIYNKLGYWNKEIYRFGVVYILNDYTLSPVFNIRGRDELEVYNSWGTSTIPYTQIPVYTGGAPLPDGSSPRRKIIINEGDYAIFSDEGVRTGIPLENARGTVRVLGTNFSQYAGGGVNATTKPIGFKMALDRDSLRELKKHVKGFFFVRQKRIPTILGQAFTIGIDRSAYTPLLKVKWGEVEAGQKDRWIAERFLDDNREITHDFRKRLYNYPKDMKIKSIAAICPEAELNMPYFNQLFTGGKFTVSNSSAQPTGSGSDYALDVSPADERYYYPKSYSVEPLDVNHNYSEVKLTLIQDDSSLLTSGTQKYSSRAGAGEEAWRVGYLEKENINTDANNLIRGAFGTYIGVEGYTNQFGKIIDIHVPGYDLRRIADYFRIRYEDKSSFFPITDRVDISLVGSDSSGSFITAYGGDCFIGNFTHRMNRNFQDPTTPVNDSIVDKNTWVENYDVSDKEKSALVNRSDINAVKLGHWMTFKLCSNINLSMRTTNDNYYTEEGLTGMPRNFFPLYSRSITGESKIPESTAMNAGLNSTTGDKYNFLLPDVPYIKNEFDTRIMYSDLHITDAFKNGYRTFKLTHYRDYTKEYGAITKVISWMNLLLVVFEHGVAAIPVNERAIAAEGAGGLAYINTSNVLPENPNMLSTNYGTQWIESVVVTPYHIYGVDTTAKKIWRTNGREFEVISDFKVQQFLNRFISLREREKTPVIGVRNVKSHYNAYKGDLMFTFYDDLYGMEETAWNLCYNELVGKWITFYSWIPSYSANISNIFFSFDRDTSKWISKLGVGNANSTSASGIVLSNNIIGESNFGRLSLAGRSLPDAKYHVTLTVSYEWGPDPYDHHKFFTLSGGTLSYKGGVDPKHPVFMLNVKANVKAAGDMSDDNIAQYVNGWNKYAELNYGYYQNTLVVTTSANRNLLTTDFWKSGQAGLIDIKDKLRPTMWYGKQHPFEFEFIVGESPGVHKILDNLYIISNKAEPESFHFEVVGEAYEFADDKKNMYYRQEATKEFYQINHSNVRFDADYKEIIPSCNPKSTIFPLYYKRVDTFNEIYDTYVRATAADRDYQNLTGSEIVREELLNEYRILTHQKAGDIRKLGRLRGNMQYKEDLWNVEVKPIYLKQKNESWTDKPPIVTDTALVPNDMSNLNITVDYLPKGYTLDDLKVGDNKWTDLKSTKIRDKYFRIRVRYSGTDLAIITAIKSIYTISYA